MQAAEKKPEDGRDSSNRIQNRNLAWLSVVSFHVENEVHDFFFR